MTDFTACSTHLERWPAGALGGRVERVVDQMLGDALLAVAHDAVDDLRHENRPVERVRLERARL